VSKAPKKTPRIIVVGSVNLDFVASGAKLPAPGETVTGAKLARHPGGKGANQALAARRLGADVRMVARVGKDGMSSEALALLKADGVDLKGVTADASAATGVALIAVSKEAENQIVVCAGANETLKPEHLPPLKADALIMQLEIPVATIAAAAERAEGMVCLNLAPAADVPVKLLNRADLIIVNEGEAAFYGEKLNKAKAMVVVTLGKAGARLLQNGKEIASAKAPKVKAVDTTGAGDTFVGALVVALLEGRKPHEALAFACAAGALTATRAGAQTSLPRRAEVDALLNKS
jgi:ribokinase